MFSNDIYSNFFYFFTGKTNYLKTKNMVGSPTEKKKVANISARVEINQVNADNERLFYLDKVNKVKLLHQK